MLRTRALKLSAMAKPNGIATKRRYTMDCMVVGVVGGMCGRERMMGVEVWRAALNRAWDRVGAGEVKEK